MLVEGFLFSPFGFQWVAEKTKGRIQAGDVTSISIKLLRKGGPNAVCEQLCSLEKVKRIISFIP